MTTAPEPTPLDSICSEIRAALGGGFYYLGLSVSLTLPDVCVSLTGDPQRPLWSKPAEYMDWVQINLVETKRLPLTKDEIYGLRCGVSHNGSFLHPKANTVYKQIAFTLPVPERVTIGQLIDTRRDANGIEIVRTTLDLMNFCEQIIAASLAWLNANKADPNVVANMPSIVRYRPRGLPPIVNGIPVIA